MLYDFAFDGITSSYVAGKLSSKALVGDASLTSSVWGQNISGGAGTTWNKTKKFWATDFKYAFDNKLSVTANLYRNISKDYQYKLAAVGVNANIGEFRFLAEGVRNTYNVTAANAQKHGYWADLRWKNADVENTGTWAINVRYLNLGKDTIDGAGTTLNYFNSDYGLKGYELGFDYAFAKGAHVNLFVGKYKPYDAQVAGFDKYNTAASAVAYFSF